MKQPLAHFQSRQALVDLAPIVRVDLHSKGVTIVQNGENPLPGVPGYGTPTPLFPGSEHNITAIHGKELQNGNLYLVFIHPDTQHTHITQTPPYTVFWATGNAADQATGGNRKG